MGLATCVPPLRALWSDGRQPEPRRWRWPGDIQVLGTAWSAAAAGWLMAELAPLGTRLVLEAMARSRAAKLRVERDRLLAAWGGEDARGRLGPAAAVMDPAAVVDPTAVMAGERPLLSGTVFAGTSARHQFYSGGDVHQRSHHSENRCHAPSTYLLEQTIEHFCWKRFDRLVRKHKADARGGDFTSRKQFLALLAAALGGHPGLRPLVTALAPNSGALHLLGGEAPARVLPRAANLPSGGTGRRIFARAARPRACGPPRARWPAIHAGGRGSSPAPACTRAAARGRTDPAGR